MDIQLKMGICIVKEGKRCWRLGSPIAIFWSFDGIRMILQFFLIVVNLLFTGVTNYWFEWLVNFNFKSDLWLLMG
jgi:hypothetical protein